MYGVVRISILNQPVAKALLSVILVCELVWGEGLYFCESMTKKLAPSQSSENLAPEFLKKIVCILLEPYGALSDIFRFLCHIFGFCENIELF